MTLRDRVLEMRRLGMPVAEIAAALSIEPAEVARHLRGTERTEKAVERTAPDRETRS